MYLLREEKRSAETREKKKRRKKERRTKRKRRHIPERRQGGGCIRERGEGEDASQSVVRKGWGGVVSQKKGEG
jgi:hypothetical protein